MTSPARRVAMLDSGLGGLTVLAALRALTVDTDYVYFADTAHVPYGGRDLSEVARLGGLPVLAALGALPVDTDSVYFADTAHVPYGGRDLSEVARLGGRIVQRLLVHEPSVIVVASGTTCAAFDSAGWPASPVPIVGVVSYGAAAAVEATSNGGIGVIATHGTVRSGIFEREVLKFRPDARVTSVAAPSLVPIVESGGWASARARDAVATVCGPILHAGCDTVILGCTHFPHLLAWFMAALGERVSIVDPGAACAAKVAQMIVGFARGAGTLTFEVSGDKDEFAAHAESLSGIRIDALRHVPVKRDGTV